MDNIIIAKIADRILGRFGYRSVRNQDFPYIVDMPIEFIKIYDFCKIYTQTSIDRMYSVYKSVCYVLDHQIPGDFVECGVWKGGSAMVAAMTLLSKGDTSRKLYLYDTYSGMSKPTDKDIDFMGKSVIDRWQENQTIDGNNWNYIPLEAVKKNLQSTNYLMDKIEFIKGRVEDTIPNVIPDVISILRLDTDFYESTAHEMQHLYPRLSNKGILIVDDYGHFRGAQEAVDEYFLRNKLYPFLHRIDYCGRLVVKD